MATILDPKSFYSSDKRFKAVDMIGMNYDNGDGGVVYAELTTVGGVTINLYSNELRQSGSLVATGAASVVTDDQTTVTLTASGGSGLSGTIVLDLTVDGAATNTESKLILTFTFDEDLQTHEKTIVDWADDSDQWEGAGTANMRFLRAHKATTKKIIEVLRTKVRRSVGLDDRQMPDLFDVFDFEQAKEPATSYCLHLIYKNQSNSADPEFDPLYARSVEYRKDFERMMNGVEMYIDVNQDDQVDGQVGARSNRWV